MFSQLPPLPVTVDTAGSTKPRPCYRKIRHVACSGINSPAAIVKLSAGICWMIGEAALGITSITGTETSPLAVEKRISAAYASACGQQSIPKQKGWKAPIQNSMKSGANSHFPDIL